jgi:hypothetical protein
MRPLDYRADRSWHSVWANISEELVPLMDELRERRITAMQLSALITRLELIKPKINKIKREAPYPFPNLADIYQMAPFRELLDRPLVNEQIDDVTLRSFAGAFEFLRAEAPEWAARRDQALIKLLPRRGTAGLSGEQRLELATTRFRCTNCSCDSWDSYDLTAHQARVHSCRFGWKALDHETSLNRICSLYYTMPWNFFKSLEFDAKTSAQVALLLPLMGLDPLTATLEDVMAKAAPGECAPSFRCKSCERNNIKAGIVRWDYAVCYVCFFFSASWALLWECQRLPTQIRNNGSCPIHQDEKLVFQREFA